MLEIIELIVLVNLILDYFYIDIRACYSIFACNFFNIAFHAPLDEKEMFNYIMLNSTI